MLRITGGKFKGQGIFAPASIKTRPTQSRLRQALFNSLQGYLDGVRVLDLFAGSGALGFEALSWGAGQVVFVESAKSVAQLILKNAELLKVRKQITVIGDSVESVVPRLEQWFPFDLVLADPPYGQDWEIALLETLPWEKLLAPEGHFCLEWSHQRSKQIQLPERVSFLAKVREKNYGDSTLTTYLKKDIRDDA